MTDTESVFVILSLLQFKYIGVKPILDRIVSIMHYFCKFIQTFSGVWWQTGI